MSFHVFAIHTIPDTETGARQHKLGDLDEKNAAKAIMHLQQQTGSPELPLYMQRIAAISSIYRGDGVSLDINSFGSEKEDENDLLKNFFKNISSKTKTNVFISWDSAGRDVPILMYRCLKNEIPSTLFNSHVPLSLNNLLSKTSLLASTSQENVMSLLNLESAPILSQKDIWELWLENKTDQIQENCTFRAIDTYRIYLRYQMVIGETSLQHYEHEIGRLDKLVGHRFGGYSK